ncbi:MAG TPA: hypothetical protein VFU23_08725 [Gemmatimonadales bacterium]|nr:hypothetical protein [Gemmatimonadales bacterium]
MTGPNRDWDKEMAEIDKIIAKQPAVPAGKPVPAGAGAPVPAALPPPARGRRAVLTAWVRVALGVAVAVGVSQWPYAHDCGMLLYAYLTAAGGVVLAGLWGAVTAWSRRRGLAHLVSLLVTLWGAALVAKAILDRSNYARHPAAWVCK